MLVRFFKFGGGKSGGIDYLLSGKDAEGQERAVLPEVFRGNAELTKSLVDGIDFEKRYTSGALSFQEKNLDDATKNQIIDAFERVLFPGLDSERYNSFWVEHRDKGRLELHFIFPNQELETGRKLVPYLHKLDCSRVNNWKICINHDYGLSSPDEPKRKQALTLSNNLPKDKKQALVMIHECVLEEVREGRVSNRAELVKYLNDNGLTVSRESENFVSIKTNENNRPIRLNGAVYERTFRGGETLEGEIERTQRRYEEGLSGRVEGARAKLEEQLEYKRERIRQLYKKPARAHDEETKRDDGLLQEISGRDDREPKQGLGGDEIRMESVSHKEPDSRVVDFCRTVSGELRGDEVPKLEHNGVVGNPGSSSSGSSSAREQGGVGPELQGDEGREIHPDTPGVQRGTDVRRETVREDQQVEVSWYDRAREKLDSFIERTREFIERARERTLEFLRHAYGRFIEGERQAHERAQVAHENGGRSHSAVQESGRCIERGIEHMGNELERFKKEINLPQYMASHGYSLVRKDSTPTSIVMQHDSGDKLVVSRQHDGHWTYFNTGDRADNGSVIDFHQKKTGHNLGETRKALRQWAGISHEVIKEFAKEIKPASRDRAAMSHEISQMESVASSKYLTARGISDETLNNDRFHGTIKADARRNHAFPHRDLDGYCGYEVKNPEFTGFSKGGERGVWNSKVKSSDNKLVITESAIDALSHFEIHKDSRTRYLSLGGTPSNKQLELIQKSVEKMPPGSEIRLAFDKDKAGNEMAETVVRGIKRDDVSIKRDTPALGKDWNEALQLKQSVKLDAPGIRRGDGGLSR
jgi:hypothetical protein